MKRTVTVAACALAIILVGCGGNPVVPSGATLADSGPSPAPTAAAVPSALPPPSATPDPEAVRKTAAAAYLKAATAYDKALAALNKKYPKSTTLARERAFYKASAKIDGDFIAAIKKIVVPSDTAGDMHSLIAKNAALQALWIEGTGKTSWAAFNDLYKNAKAASRTASGAANLVRSDLGLPPVPKP